MHTHRERVIFVPPRDKCFVNIWCRTFKLSPSVSGPHLGPSNKGARSPLPGPWLASLVFGHCAALTLDVPLLSLSGFSPTHFRFSCYLLSLLSLLNLLSGTITHTLGSINGS